MASFSNQNTILNDYISEKVIPQDDFSDQELLEKIKVGDQRAFHELYQRYYLDVYNYLLSTIWAEQTAEDILQEVFVILWQDGKKFRGDSSLKTWLIRIAHHKAVDFLRKTKDASELDEVYLIDDSEPHDTLIIKKDQIEEINRAVAQLKPLQRAVIDLVFRRELSYQEAAEVMDCPVGTIKSRLNYALICTRRILSARNEQDE
jgi:RNA polymerase sigma-70 factor (ECF subfamily)